MGRFLDLNTLDKTDVNLPGNKRRGRPSATAPALMKQVPTPAKKVGQSKRPAKGAKKTKTYVDDTSDDPDDSQAEGDTVPHPTRPPPPLPAHMQTLSEQAVRSREWTASLQTEGVYGTHQLAACQGQYPGEQLPESPPGQQKRTFWQTSRKHSRHSVRSVSQAQHGRTGRDAATDATRGQAELPGIRRARERRRQP